MKGIQIESTRGFKRSIALAITALAIIVVTVLLYRRSSVELSEEDYAITLALYRVCNQRSEQGLNDLEEAWSESGSSRKETESRQIIESIIANARSKHWQEAARACRGILDDQVEY